MSHRFRFDHFREFRPAWAEDLLRSIPAAPGIFALRGENAEAEPYLTRAADLRRRLKRLLGPPEIISAAPGMEDQAGSSPGELPLAPIILSRRLNLRERVRSVEWTQTGSEFEANLLLYAATRDAFGAERARTRLKLRAPHVVRLTSRHEFPRLYVTNRLSGRSLDESFGPFPSRAAAERYVEAVQDLFQLRRCHEDLVVHPEHPGCAYGEMRRCMAPCKAGLGAAAYRAEAERVHAFLHTRGESLLAEIAADRDRASEDLDFEAAAAAHVRWEKARAAANLADPLVRPLTELRALVVQEAAPRARVEAADENPGPAERIEEAAVFLLEGGQLAGPERLSTLGVRAVREQTAVGSSLFAQPLMLAAVPLEQDAGVDQVAGDAVLPVDLRGAVSLSPEGRAQAMLEHLSAQVRGGEPDPGERADALALFRRWYYRPEKSRAGEVFLPNADGSWPVRRLLNGAARVVLGPPAELSPADREAAREATKALKTKVLHAGREGVERIVPVLPKRSRARKSVLPSDVLQSG